MTGMDYCTIKNESFDHPETIEGALQEFQRVDPDILFIIEQNEYISGLISGRITHQIVRKKTYNDGPIRRKTIKKVNNFTPSFISKTKILP